MKEENRGVGGLSLRNAEINKTRKHESSWIKFQKIRWSWWRWYLVYICKVKKKKKRRRKGVQVDPLIKRHPVQIINELILWICAKTNQWAFRTKYVQKGEEKEGVVIRAKGQHLSKRGVNPSQNHTLESSEEEVKHNASINITNKYIEQYESDSANQTCHPSSIAQQKVSWFHRKK